MNDTELLDLILTNLSFNKEAYEALPVGKGPEEGMTRRELDQLIEYIKRERAEETLNEKIRLEVKRQINKRR